MEPNKSFIICTSPRSGSTLLAEGLKSTQLAGNPEEWFESNMQAAYLKRFELSLSDITTNYQKFFDIAVLRATTSNGIVGFKSMSDGLSILKRNLQTIPRFKGLSEDEILDFAFPNLQYIWLRRRDKIRQAVSYTRASLTGIWSVWKGDDIRERPNEEFVLEEVVKHHALLDRFDFDWEIYFKGINQIPIVVYYEDLAENFERTIIEILDRLQISYPKNLEIKATNLIRQSDEVTEDWIEKYSIYLNPKRQVMYKVVPDDWIQWIDNSIAAGVQPSKLVETMVDQQFDPEICRGVISQRQQFVAKRGADSDLSGSEAPYFYEEPRFKNVNFVQTNDRVIPILMTMDQPEVVLFESVFTSEECDALIELSSEKVVRATVVDPKTGKDQIHPFRTSSGTFIKRNDNELIIRLDKRISELLSIPLLHGEDMQILRYEVGEQYKPHFDYFQPEKDGHTMILKEGGQRIATFVVYLNDVTAGGETIFPKVGLSFSPKKGNGVFFSYCNSHGQTDPQTFHGGNPVTAGVKWLATKWIRGSEYRK